MILKQSNIHDFIKVIIRRRGIIFTFFTVLVLTVLIGTLKQKPIYEGKATIRIEKSGPRVTTIQEVAPMGVSDDYWAYKDYYETQYKLLRSPMLMKRVAGVIGMADGNTVLPEEKLNKAVRILPVKGSQLVDIIAEDTGPDTAAKIANAVAEEFIKYNLERNINTAGAAANWLTNKIDEHRQKLAAAELALQKYREENKINVLPTKAVGELAAEDIKTEYAKLQSLLSSYAERYTDEHPKVVELKSQINSLKNKIQGLEDVDAGNKAIEYRSLEREEETNRRMYEILLSRLKEVDVTSTLNVNNISIVDKAEAPEKPAKPNLILNMVLAVIVGLVGGIGLGVFVEYMDMTIKSPTDVQENMESRFLGEVPEFRKGPERERDMIAHFQPSSVISENYRHIRTEVLSLLPKGSDLKSIVITSAEPQAGKTMTSTNIAITMAQLGNKILFVDADMRKPQLHKVFNLNRFEGLSEYLAGSAGMNVILKDAGIENLKIVTSGNSIENPAERIGSKRMEEFIAEAKRMFDFVIFDSSPIISVTDAVILSGMVDASIMVIRSGKLLVSAAKIAQEKLSNKKAKYLGVVLNRMKAEHSDYGYYNYHRYYNYYGEKGQGSGTKKKKES